MLLNVVLPRLVPTMIEANVVKKKKPSLHKKKNEKVFSVQGCP